MGYVAKVLAACGGFEGVAPGLLNECAPTANGANTVAVNTGGALVDGKPYYNSASVDVNVPSALGAGNTRIDRIVLRAGWAAQTVRITRIAGTDAASPTAPALTQTPGTTYDISLCTVLVDTAGAVTVTDARTMASPFLARQGGSPTNWNTAGTSKYIPSKTIIQSGAYQWTGAASPSGTAIITYPVAFAAYPIVFITAVTTETSDIFCNLSGMTADQVGIIWRSSNSSNQTAVNLHWLAIGPRA